MGQKIPHLIVRNLIFECLVVNYELMSLFKEPNKWEEVKLLVSVANAAAARFSHSIISAKCEVRPSVGDHQICQREEGRSLGDVGKGGGGGGRLNHRQ